MDHDERLPNSSHPFDALPDPVVIIDADGVLRFVNRAADVLLGWGESGLVGRSSFDIVHPDDANLIRATLGTAADKPYGDIIRIRVSARGDEWKQLELRGVRHEVDGTVMTTVIARDTSDRYHFGFDQGDTDRLRSVMANMNSMVVLVDPDGTIRSFNAAVTRLLGHDPDIMRGTDATRCIHPDESARIVEAVASLDPIGSVRLDARLLSLGAGWVTCEFTVKNLCDDPAIGGYLASGEIATTLSDARQRVDFLAEHDTRTGLLNRDGFLRAAGALLLQGDGLGLMVIDIARFRSINELYGEPVGDAVLASVAKRLAGIRWPGLVTARFGADEFVLAAPSFEGDPVSLLRERVELELASAVSVDDVEITLSVRTAIAEGSRTDSLESLLARASNELMRAKRNTGEDDAGIALDSVRDRRVHLDRLRSALDDDEIRPFFQPIVDVNGRLQAVEALVRWLHPDRGVLGVREFLPLARMAGLAETIDDRVLDHSLRFAARLTAAGYGHVEVHVNVDPKVISRAAFAARFLDRCVSHGARPEQMVVEITETDLLAPGAASLGNMSELRRAGTHVSIDDFGTGYSSLSHLLRLPVDGVKIDQTFVAGIDVDDAATNLTTAILGLSESLKLSCVAEGVEHVYQRDRLASLGCVSFQGWLYSPAVSPDEILDLLPAIEITSPDD